MKQAIAVSWFAGLMFAASACVVDDAEDTAVVDQALGAENDGGTEDGAGGGESLAPLPVLSPTSFTLAFGYELSSFANVVAPDGVTHDLREKLIGPGCIGFGCLDLRAEYRYDNLPAAAGSYTFSFRARITPGTSERFRIYLVRPNGIAVPFDGAGGCVIATPNLETGWCHAHFTKPAGDTYMRVTIDDMNYGPQGTIEVDYVGLIPGHVPVDMIAPRSVWSTWTANTASVTYADPYAQHVWSITGGYLTSSPYAPSVLFAAGAPGTVMNLRVDRNYPLGTDTHQRRVFVDFLDVPPDFPAHDDIVTLAGTGVTAGCGGGNYCPTASLTREQMAVLLLRGKEGTGYTPPPAQSPPMFADVPSSSPYAPWIEELVRRGVTGGCGGGNYCPTDPVTRAQIAVFVLKTDGGPNYYPPPAQHWYTDVDPAFEPWVEEAVRRDMVMPCGAQLYCPDNAISRARLATAVVRGFRLAFP